jgi:L-arabinose isomerase
MGQGVCALFPARPAPVTLVNLVPCQDGYQCGLLEGEALSTELVFPGNPVRVRFVPPTDRLIAWIFQQGLGRHWALGYGHVGAEIRQWARMCGRGLTLVEP